MPDHLTEQQLTDIETRANAATKGPWGFYDGDTYADVAADLQMTSRASYSYRQKIAQLEDENYWDDPDHEEYDEQRAPEQMAANAAFIAHAREDVPTLVVEVRRLRDELAEEKASHNPRLRCLIVKTAKDRDQYVGWSTIADGPTGVWSRQTALAYGFPPSRLNRADLNGSSDLSCGDGHWDDKGWVADQRGWLRRDRIGEYAVEYLHGDRQAAYALLEPFDDEPAGQ
ncbi:hypothetical protein DCW30_05700 [Streptomyces alfalfae]|uniref:Uncharacterized protein n=1 Tax=Streptomyces alfalfae TaxID=1642299 RepID=A0ABN4VSP4_9ACTN|nr:hypothetical protein [Streptomyces alfalfae]APY88205.1 hypothetical protein A7J05_23175 [Streptomyces alfalfae]AYA18600.1 hypothetical protein D3X13_22285 [Streptomyces fradiae]RXX46520.1 hypothetical protein DCW30_05700 [Streptomyces alfalfae]RZM90033.1 hypothetical protein D4104_25635 [Streptomyces alfalfae]